MDSTLGLVLAFTAAIAWGSGSTLFKLGVKNNVKTLVATFLRGLLAVPILILMSILLHGFNSLLVLFQGMNAVYLLLSALFVTLGDFFSLIAMKNLDISITQPISSIYPIITTFILLIFALEVITILIIVGTILNVLGVFVISYFTNRKSKKKLFEHSVDKKEDETVKGITFSLLAALFWGFTIIMTKLLLLDPGVKVVSVLAIRNGLMVLIMFIVSYITALKNNVEIKQEFFPSYRDSLTLMLGGIVMWVIGGVSFFTAVNIIGAGRSTPISAISPFVVLLLSGIFLKEKIKYVQIFGVLLIVIGSILLSV